MAGQWTCKVGSMLNVNLVTLIYTRYESFCGAADSPSHCIRRYEFTVESILTARCRHALRIV